MHAGRSYAERLAEYRSRIIGVAQSLEKPFVDETTRPIVTRKTVEPGKQPGFGRHKVGFLSDGEQRALKLVGFVCHLVAASPRTHNKWERCHQHREARETIDPEIEDRDLDTQRLRCFIQ